MTLDVQATPLLRPWWQRARLWIGIGAVVIIGAALVGTLSEQPGRALDPRSTQSDGSKALARLLAHYGAPVTATSSVDTALKSEVVVVTEPDDYSAGQLQAMGSAARLVLVQPGTRALADVPSKLQPDPQTPPDEQPNCSDAGAQAAGRVDFPSDTTTYTGDVAATSCYRGAVVVANDLVVLGSSAMLTNEHLADSGVAAVDVNVITADREFVSVAWLAPGSDAGGPGPASVWDLFPAAAYRAFWWLLFVGVLLALWRARRLGGVVSEPLPVVVRSAELVEGHGRLYARAAALDRAAAAFRAAVLARLIHRLGLPRGASAEQVAAAVAPAVGRPPGDVLALLAGPAPPDNAALTRMVHELDRLEAGLQEGDPRS